MKHIRWSLAATLMCLTGALPLAAASGAANIETDQSMIDPPRNAEHPARNMQLVIGSGPVQPELGRPAEMNALFFLAAGDAPKPTLLLLHGLPGNERNMDLAQAVRRAGWNVLTFTYRGAWGSEGSFSLRNAIDDSSAALTFLRSPEAMEAYGVNPDKIVLAGHSMGGYMAAHTAAWADVEANQERESYAPLAGVILLDAWDIGSTARQVRTGGAAGREALLAEMNDIGHALGSTTADDIVDELISEGEDWSLAKLAPTLQRLHILTIFATHGGAEENRLLADDMGACFAGAAPDCDAAVRAVELNSDHSFADSRLVLATKVVGWLAGLISR